MQLAEKRAAHAFGRRARAGRGAENGGANARRQHGQAAAPAGKLNKQVWRDM